MKARTNQPKKPRHVCSWLLCLFFCLCISAGGCFTIPCMVACAVLVSPPFRTKFHLPTPLWVPAVIILLVVGCITSPIAGELSNPDPSISPQISSILISEKGNLDVATLTESQAVPETETAQDTDNSPLPDANTEMQAQATADASAESSDTIVYITKTGSKYHLSSCYTLKSSKMELTLEEAKAQGYEPCQICHPPT